MNKITGFFRIPKRTLLLVAGIVWFAAGINIARIGWLASDRAFTVLSILSSAAVFAAFFFLIFRRLIKKHTARIMGYGQERVNIFRFFDLKSYCIMAFMMTFGILLRQSNLWPPQCIKMFYLGIGAALIGAGIGFLLSFIKQGRISRQAA